MWGEGYDFAQQYSVSSGDIVGSLPVGMMTRGNADVPYWPSQNGFVYKEVWVHPSARWLWLMQDLAGPALLQGRAAPGAAGGVIATDVRTGRAVRVASDPADGTFRAFLPQGLYELRAEDRRARVTLLPAATRLVDLRRPHAVDFTVDAGMAPDGRVTIRVSATGEGRHTFAIRAVNLVVEAGEREVLLERGRPATVTWKARTHDGSEPWVVVVVADGDVSQRRDLIDPTFLRPENRARAGR
jgi:hypothetical protein